MARCRPYARPGSQLGRCPMHVPQSTKFPAILQTQQLRSLMFTHLKVHSRARTGRLAQLPSETAVTAADTWEQNREEWVHLKDNLADATTAHPSISWDELWYPVGILNNLDPATPKAIQVLGRRMVLWRDSHKQWRCFEDRCPHRLAPLSEGRIDQQDGGTLMCNYHGWRFDGMGKCMSIPQLEESKMRGMASNQRACATSYPTQESEGLVWVWPSTAKPPEGPPGMCPELDDESGPLHHAGWTSRLQNNSYVTVKENSYNDSSHEWFLHHGIGSLRRGASVPITSEVTGMSESGFTSTTTIPGGPHYVCRNTAVGATRANPVFTAVAYSTPVSEYQTLVIFGAFLNEKPKPTPSLFGIPLKLPLDLNGLAWVLHPKQHAVVDADIATGAGIDLNRAAGKGNRIFIPAQADRQVAAFHRWLNKYAAGGPFPTVWGIGGSGPKGTPAMTMTRQQLLDRYHTHTKTCPSCSTAFLRASQAIGVAKVWAAFCFVAAIALAARGSLAWAAGLAVAGVATKWAENKLQSFVQSMIFVDYDEKHVSKM